MWTELFDEKVRFRSLAGGRSGLEFTMDSHSLGDVTRYFEGLARDWEMINYKTEPFAVEGDRIVMMGSTSWRNRKTGQVFDTPKADLITFRNGKIVEFFELYDTDRVLVATR